MTLFVVRHADAGPRSEWIGDDRIRPLTRVGVAQAQGIASLLAGDEPELILSSPATRCVQTVEPLAEKLGREVTVDHRLFEGVGPGEVESLLADHSGTPTVLCSHGDVIPMVLEHLVRLGMRPERDLVWEKASVWVVEREEGGWGRGRYLSPPVG